MDGHGHRPRLRRPALLRHISRRIQCGISPRIQCGERSPGQAPNDPSERSVHRATDDAAEARHKLRQCYGRSLCSVLRDQHEPDTLVDFADDSDRQATDASHKPGHCRWLVSVHVHVQRVADHPCADRALAQPGGARRSTGAPANPAPRAVCARSSASPQVPRKVLRLGLGPCCPGRGRRSRGRRQQPVSRCRLARSRVRHQAVGRDRPGRGPVRFRRQRQRPGRGP